jgi:hypothetical protein
MMRQKVAKTSKRNAACRIFHLEVKAFLEIHRPSASQKIHCIFWGQEVYYRVYKKPTLIFILNQTSPVHVLQLHYS